MARRGRRRLVVPGAEQGMSAFKAEVMRREGFTVDPSRPDDVKYEVARSLGVPLKPGGDNGELTTESVGHVGGRIGGTMVREMIRLAQEELVKQPRA
ncbi:alpha/beta-type small acid-soluble spore protein [Paenibacillus spongiae]|uniref:Alpha/beta-type small acid-soluble spore protein n=1 Tax=Paenibacillus spongiae TaxID=2909671 RepID=A0ABY5SA76_9BACL|nr:alpha/beta-type small acid-soluble spore protein [Paenibacillus spongiae]UVI30819.1 alpha/beta-type small acid-soluble spore protein [Paenibacillus spongiae]